MRALESIGDRIRTLREQGRLTQVDLAVQIGVSRAHLAGIETGKDLPGRALMAAIATHFDVSLDWLARGHGDMRPTQPVTEQEATLLFAFRQMPPEQGDALLKLILHSVRTKGS